MVCNDNKQASNNKAKKRKVTKSNTTNVSQLMYFKLDFNYNLNIKFQMKNVYAFL